MYNVGFNQMAFKGNYGRYFEKTAKEALEKAKAQEENGVLRNLMKVDESGSTYYELYSGQKCYSRDQAIYEIGKNLIDYIR